jgi:sugar phosphate isomerase/epimerase
MIEQQTVSNFGYKVVDNDREKVAVILEHALGNRIPLEVGLYYQDQPTLELLDQRLIGSGLEMNTHLDHRILNAFSLQGREEKLREQIETSLRWGAGYGINHIANSLMTPRSEHQSALMERLLTNLREMNRIAGEYDFSIHIENTYHGIAFYRIIFDTILQNGLENLHCCFDMGHAKVWSTNPLREWLNFLGDISRRGISLHFHLHANRGLNDEHLSFVNAPGLDFTQADYYTTPWSTFEALNEIAERFPGARKIFEVPGGEALDNLSAVSCEIQGIRGREPLIA